MAIHSWDAESTNGPGKGAYGPAPRWSPPAHLQRDQPIGYQSLLEDIGSPYRPPHRTSVRLTDHSSAHRYIDTGPNQHLLISNRGGSLPDTPAEHLLASIHYDGVDLESMRQILPQIDPREIAAAIKAAPTGKAERRLWFLTESLTGEHLDIEDASRHRVSAVPLLDPRRYVTMDQGRSRRHGVLINTLGNPQVCPTIRRTDELETLLAADPLAHRDRMAAALDGEYIRRLNHYLATDESLASYRIEGERPRERQRDAYADLLEEMAIRPPGITEEDCHRLHAAIMGSSHLPGSVGPIGRYRRDQTFIGGRHASGAPRVQYVPPAPEDLEQLMDGYCAMASSLTMAARSGHVDPVMAASAIGSALVYIHPYHDGNGRMSRLLLQSALGGDNGPDAPRLTLPISSAIDRHRAEYYASLDTASARIMRSVDWSPNDQGRIIASGNQADLYRFPDITDHATYLARMADECLHQDLAKEERILRVYDASRQQIDRSLGDALSERDAHLLYRCALQNRGAISKRKRSSLFEHLDPDVIDQIERIYADSGMDQLINDRS